MQVTSSPRSSSSRARFQPTFPAPAMMVYIRVYSWPSFGVRHLALAIADFTTAIRFDPKMISAYDERASAYEQTGAHDRALADIAQAIKLDPSNPDLHRLK